ncbi:MAG: OmpA family protein [Elusimicrobiota bacterium]|jgi:outer membrane protein OmpA-like peptidoglycan-associated protein|nr:OmpA family protein [Elusimicrobiota bacterium]
MRNLSFLLKILTLLIAFNTLFLQQAHSNPNIPLTDNAQLQVNPNSQSAERYTLTLQKNINSGEIVNTFAINPSKPQKAYGNNAERLNTPKNVFVPLKASKTPLESILNQPEQSAVENVEDNSLKNIGQFNSVQSKEQLLSAQATDNTQKSQQYYKPISIVEKSSAVGIFSAPSQMSSNERSVWNEISRDERLLEVYAALDSVSNDDARRNALADLGGEFLVNLLAFGARPAAIADVLEQSHRQQFWILANINGFKIFDNVKTESPQDRHRAQYLYSSKGIRAGLGLNEYFGFFTAYDHAQFRQFNSSATADNIEFGAYSINNFNRLNLKLAVSVSQQHFETERDLYYLDLGKIENGFYTYALKASGQIGYAVYKAQTSLIPFIALDAAYIENPKITEYVEPGSLIVGEHYFTRIAAKYGLEILTASNAISWTTKFYIGNLFAGNREPYNMYFGQSPDNKFIIQSKMEDENYFGVQMNLDIALSKRFWVFANGAYEMGQLSYFYNANFGFGIKFGGAQKEPQPQPQKPVAAPEIAPIPKSDNSAAEEALAQKEIDQNVQSQEIINKRMRVASFAVGSSVLSEQAKKNIKAIAAVAIKIGYKRIVVEAHADAQTEAADALSLSRQRSDIVFREFVANGISPLQIQANGFGDAPSAKGGLNNRVVNVYVE